MDSLPISDNTITLLALAVWAVSEALGLSSKVPANGILHALILIVKRLAGKG